MAHWHSQNPWATRLVYCASLEEWLSCLAIPESRPRYSRMLHDHRIGDAYLLPQPNGEICMGYRFGPEGSDYWSPPCDQKRAAAIIAKYQPQGTAA